LFRQMFVISSSLPEHLSQVRTQTPRKMFQYCCCTPNPISLESQSYPFLKCTIFWGVTPCSPVEVHLRFEGTYCLHLQGSSLHSFLHNNAPIHGQCLLVFPLILLDLSKFLNFPYLVRLSICSSLPLPPASYWLLR
jgi:hypothetical protein